MPEHYNVLDPAVWGVWEPGAVFRFLPADAAYEAWEPWPTSEGRFDDGNRATLYLSRSREGAVAEFYRKHPELLHLQHKVKHRLFRMDLEAHSQGLAVETAGKADVVGIPYERLTSSDSDPGTRYRECRRLAADVDNEGGIGISYPAAAYPGVTHVVAFHSPGPERWEVTQPAPVEVPTVDPPRVNVV